jgi:alpha-galactosidase
VSWILPTATSRYVVDLAGDDAGLVLQDWTEGEIARWVPTDQHSFDTPPDRLPSELSALGTRQVRGADLIIDHGGALVGARLVWPSGGVDFTEDGPQTRLTAHGYDTTGDFELMLEIEASREHDVVSKRVTLFNSGSRAITLRRAFGPAWELPIGPGAVVDVLGGDWGREFTPYRIGLPVGELSLGSRQGITSHTYSPVVRAAAAVDRRDLRTASRSHGADRGDSWSIRRLIGNGCGWLAVSTTSPPSSGLSRARPLRRPPL